MFWRFSRGAFFAGLMLATLGLASLALPTARPPTKGCYWYASHGAFLVLPSYGCHGFPGAAWLAGIMNGALAIFFYLPLSFVVALWHGDFAALGTASLPQTVLGLAAILLAVAAIATPARWLRDRLRRRAAGS